jgi:site-specific DNA recombinase
MAQTPSTAQKRRRFTIGDDGEVAVLQPLAPPGQPDNGVRYALLYLRLSDLDHEAALTGRAEMLRKLADGLGYTVPPDGLRIENDMDGDKPKPASAFKRKRVILTMDDGTEVVQYRVIRPVFQGIMRDLAAGRAHAMLAEDLDRIARDPRDLEDCIDVTEHHGADIRSRTPGQINLTTGDGITMARVLVAFANKASRDTGRRVSDSHNRLFGTTFRGGDGGFGFRPDQHAPKYAKRLLQEPAEAAIIKAAYADILDRNIALSAVAKELRERGLTTRRGGRWDTTSLRGALLKPSVAGYDAHGDRLAAVPWIPAIVTPERWRAMIAKLEDPSRRRGPQNVPHRRYLLSGLAKCGECGAGMSGSTRGTRRPYPVYVGRCRHAMRKADRVEPQIVATVLRRLSMPDAADLLKPPPPVSEGEAERLRAEVQTVRRLMGEKRQLHTEGLIDLADLRRELAGLRARLADAEVALAAPSAPDPLAEFRGRPAEEVWADLTMARRRAVIALLFSSIVIHRAGGRGHGRWHVSPDHVQVTWREEARPAAA